MRPVTRRFSPSTSPARFPPPSRAPAPIAGQIPEGLRLEVVDSCTATVAQGAMVLEAAVIAQRGGTIEEALERIDAIRRSYHIYFSPDTLDNLVKGGRATKAQGVATTLLNIKLVIGLLEDGLH